MDSAKLGGFRFQFVDSAYSCGFPDNSCLLKTYTIICSWFYKLVLDSAHFVADSAKLPVFGAIFSNTVIKLFVRGIQNSREDHCKVGSL